MSEREYSPSRERLDRDDLRARKHDRARFHTLDRTPIALVLDGVFGSYNQGAIFRLADAFLIERIHFCGTPVIAGHRRFLKAARGTHPWVPYTSEEEVTAVVQRYADQGYQVVAVEQCEGSVSVLDLNDQLRAPLCLVLGGELSGVSPEALELAELVVEHPTLGMANSLNVAMSAGMLVLSAYRSIQGRA
ncbi:MAG: TrmH family RNA methyltransferase [Myxococcota bacterium]|nr:TrmH family RNA methyltransferase [Myxococcota bacterium]